MTSYAQQTWTDNVTPVDSAHMTHIEQGIGGALAIPSYGTSLPASPVDGQRAVLVDSTTNPSYQWEFRYNAGSTSAYKWEYVGGADAYAQVAASETTSTYNTWVDLATPGPLVTVPRAGDYYTLCGATAQQSVAGANLVIAPWNGTAAGSGISYVPAAIANTNYSIPGFAAHWTGIAAGSDLRLRYQNQAGSGTATFQFRWVLVRPVRVS
jgi:hypothetical protein